MSRPHSTVRKRFTVEEANAALPLVRAIVADLTELASDVIQRRERLSVLLAGRRRDDCDPYWQELAQVQEELRKDTRCLRGLVEELAELGVKPRSVTQGLVDFPAVVDGRLVCLSWKLGEPEVRFWREPDAAVSDRRPLVSEGGRRRQTDSIHA